jgi:hypothetical protein
MWMRPCRLDRVGWVGDGITTVGLDGLGLGVLM